MGWKAIFILAVVVGITGAVIYGRARWERKTAALRNRLEESRIPIPAVFIESELDSLPLPVRRYLRTVLKPKQMIVSAVTIHQRGSFNMSATEEKWRPFTA